MVAFLAALAAVTAGVLLGLAVAVVRRSRDLLPYFMEISASLRDLSEGPETTFSLRLRDIEDAVERLPKKWEDIKREASASESRARAHIKRAQKELDERGFADPGVDQMGYELGVIDGDGGEGEGVYPVREEMESVEGQSGTVEVARDVDWREAANSRKFG